MDRDLEREDLERDLEREDLFRKQPLAVLRTPTPLVNFFLAHLFQVRDATFIAADRLFNRFLLWTSDTYAFHFFRTVGSARARPPMWSMSSASSYPEWPPNMGVPKDAMRLLG